MGAGVVILQKSNRKISRCFDKDLYKERNIIEGMLEQNQEFLACCQARHG
jgi:hypothetical protein